MNGVLSRHDINAKFEWIKRVRFVAAFLMLLVFTALRLMNLLDFPFLLFAAAPLFEMFVNQPYPWIVRRFRNYQNVFFVNQLLDVLAITWGLHFTGGMNIYALILVYPLVFIFTGTILGAGRAYFMANFSFFCYAFLTWLEFTGKIPVVHSMESGIPGHVRFINVLLVLPLYNLIAFFTSYLTGMLRQSLEKQKILQQSNEELETFAAMVSHDLQEPLAKVVGFSELIEMEAGDRLKASEKDYLNRMKTASVRMQEMIQGVLEYSRVSARPAPLETIKLREVIQQVATDLEARMREAGGRIDDSGLEDFEIMANRLQMQRLFQNLISNALKYHKKGECPVVVIRTQKSGRHEVVISVSDNGIGFDPKYKSEIFKPFSRLRGSSEYGGAGIGLAVCERIIYRHGGTIEADGVLGQGTTFSMRLPLAGSL